MADDLTPPVVFPLGGPEIARPVLIVQDLVVEPRADEGRDWRPWLISGAALLVLIGLGAWYLTRSTGPATTVAPNAVGLPQAQARDRLVQAGFTVTSVFVPSSQPSGTIVAQAPPAGGRLAPGTLVRINVSSGIATAAIPGEVGQTVDAAQSDLAARGFSPVVVQSASDQPAGTVIAQSPAGGQARHGSTVRLTVSNGPTPTTVVTTTATTVTVPTTATVTVPTAT